MACRGCGSAKYLRLPLNATQQEFRMKDDIVIVSATRTPVGAFNGAFANLPAHELGKAAIKGAMERAGVEGARISEVIMGQILTAGQGQNPARQASIAAAIPVETPAWGVNQLCGSGLRAVALGYQAILNGDSDIVVAGGQESMSMAPHCQHLRNGIRMGFGMLSMGITWVLPRRMLRSSGRSPANSRMNSPSPRRTRPKPRRRPANS